MAQVPAQRAANDARLDPQPGDKQHTPGGDVWTVVSVADGTVTLHTGDHAPHTIPLGLWARVVDGFRWEAAPAQRTPAAAPPAQRTPEDARLRPQPGDCYYTHNGTRYTVLCVNDSTVTYTVDDERAYTTDIAIWSWKRSGEGYRWEPAPPAPVGPPVGDTCAPGREVPPPKRTPWEARFNPQPGDRQYTDAGNTWVVVTVDGGGLMVDVYGGAADKEPWRGGMTREYWAASPPSAAFRWEPGPGAGAGAYAGPECDPAPPDFNARPARWCAGGPGVSCGAA